MTVSGRRRAAAILGLWVATSVTSSAGQDAPGPAGSRGVFVPAGSDAQAPAVPGRPPRDRPPTPKGTARVRGRVVAADTATPLRRAHVTLVAAESAFVRFSTTTDAEGRYEVVDMPPGRYTVTATKGGYVSLQYGQRRPFEQGTAVNVADGQTLAGINLPLPRGGVIAGRISDEFGEPVAQAQVFPQRYTYGVDGVRRLVPVGLSVATDDLGQFRLYGLMPGEYVVSAMYRNPLALTPAGFGGDTSEGFLPTFHPGTVNAAEAQPVSVAIGQESSVQFALSAARMARVSGIVTSSAGRPIAGAMVILMPSAGVPMGISPGQTGPDGAFSLSNVAPGDYILQVQNMAVLGPADAAESAMVPVTVGGSNVDGLRIATGPGTLVTGRVEFEGTAPRTGGPLPLRIIPQSLVPGRVAFGGPSPAASGLVADDGAFQLQLNGAAGPVFFRVSTPPSWALKAVLLENDDVTDSPLELTGQGQVDGLRVVLTDKLTTVTGRAVDSRGQPLADYVVVVQPSDPREGVAATRFLRVLRPDQDGGFTARGLPPGRYFATAVESFEQGRQFAPDVRARLREKGKAFALAEGGTASLDLPLATGVD